MDCLIRKQTKPKHISIVWLYQPQETKWSATDWLLRIKIAQYWIIDWSKEIHQHWQTPRYQKWKQKVPISTDQGTTVLNSSWHHGNQKNPKVAFDRLWQPKFYKMRLNTHKPRINDVPVFTGTFAASHMPFPPKRTGSWSCGWFKLGALKEPIFFSTAQEPH